MMSLKCHLCPKSALAIRCRREKESERGGERMEGGGEVKMWIGGGGRGEDGGGRLCVREAFNPQKHPDGSCSVQMGTKGC